MIVLQLRHGFYDQIRTHSGLSEVLYMCKTCVNDSFKNRTETKYVGKSSIREKRKSRKPMTDKSRSKREHGVNAHSTNAFVVKEDSRIAHVDLDPGSKGGKFRS